MKAKHEFKTYDNKYEVMIDLAYYREAARKTKNREYRKFLLEKMIPALERLLKYYYNHTE